tara:strand:- start:175 stop:378 length:204 start_codon:yes stop_codon:yes gene_type:complete
MKTQKKYTFNYIINDKNGAEQENGILEAQASNRELAINVIKKNAIKLFKDYADRGNKLSLSHTINKN